MKEVRGPTADVAEALRHGHGAWSEFRAELTLSGWLAGARHAMLVACPSPRAVLEGEAVVIRVNDANREVPSASTVGALLSDLGLAERHGIAVALNDCVVPRSDWTRRELCEADRVVVLQAVQGG